MIVPSFDQLLASLHSPDGASVTDTDTNHIEITSSRRFVIPDGFEKTIAYEGDVNSQVVTFIAPRYSDGHDLSKCANKRLRWSNLASGNEGSSVLTCPEVATDVKELKLFWAAPAEAFTKAGKLIFSISFFDFSTTNPSQIAYSWNTAECSELTVGASLETVGPRGKEDEDGYIPAKDEILVINTDKRTISAPAGYRHTICNYGDVNTSVVYFQIKRYIRGIDVLGVNTQINIYSKLGTATFVNRSKEENTDAPTRSLYAAELNGRDGEGVVNIVWKPTNNITNNQLRYIGKFRIQIEIVSGDKVWRTSAYDDLTIGEGITAFAAGDLPVTDEDGNAITGYLINGNGDFTNMSVTSVAGLVALRQFTLYHPINLNRNELAVAYDEDGKYLGVKIGTYTGQSSTEAPYVTTNPSTTIIVQGGNSNP